MALECFAENFFVVWRNVKSGKIPIFLLQMQQARMYAVRSIIANEREMSRLGGELKRVCQTTRSSMFTQLFKLPLLNARLVMTGPSGREYELCVLVDLVVLG